LHLVINYIVLNSQACLVRSVMHEATGA
jgi:hypothetical protein